MGLNQYLCRWQCDLWFATSETGSSAIALDTGLPRRGYIDR